MLPRFHVLPPDKPFSSRIWSIYISSHINLPRAYPYQGVICRMALLKIILFSHMTFFRWGHQTHRRQGSCSLLIFEFNINNSCKESFSYHTYISTEIWSLVKEEDILFHVTDRWTPQDLELKTLKHVRMERTRRLI